MTPQEYMNRCIADDLELHPEQDPAAVAREWRQMAWAGGWAAQGRSWRRQAKASRLRREREALEKLVAATRRAMEAVERLTETTKRTADAFEPFDRAWNRLGAS